MNKPKKRLPHTGCTCTRCGRTGDHNFRRTAYGTLESWCKECHRTCNRTTYRRAHPNAIPRIKDGIPN